MMRTPAGKECRYFYGNYYRGKQQEECRLLNSKIPPQRWSRDLCQTCPVPDLLQANACENLILEGNIQRPFPYLRRMVSVSAYCTLTHRDVAEPHVGCGECHPLPSIFAGEIRDPDITG
ncbi:MAG TPA: hypothetical protein VJ436_01845 [Anaerolineales bacterium]|nr:hypothetical protein [Anaerolineales bacterium]